MLGCFILGRGDARSFNHYGSIFVEKFIAGRNRCRKLNLILNFNVLFFNEPP